MKSKTYHLLGLITLFLSSCATMQIDVPNNELVQHKVKGSQGIRINQTVSFDDYQTQYIKRSWNKSHKRAFGFSNGEETVMIGGKKKKNEMTFVLTSATTGTSEVFMSNALRSRNLFFNSGDKVQMEAERYRKKDSLQNNCYAHIYLDDAEKPWLMQVNNAEVEMYKDGIVGKIMLDTDNYYTVKTVIKTKPKSISKIPVGFQFENKQGEIVGAISLIDNGTIFLKKSNEKEKLLMSSAALVLLLRDDFVD
ncbi:MAG: hypothetical protein REI64_00420 [Pedobacter sp.]|uniref:hypothetical protein n=1 Tax=Pedobacter sp. TaxID=1411316 RepID=UPI0028076952|nr:hypothetical protein [Pedobacter sp.]MDQ8003225.1 hypothetical protein [Pedobacter sp.]